MLLLRKYFNKIIVELEERYNDTFVGQTRIMFRNIGQQATSSLTRSFSTTSVRSNIGLDTLQAGIDKLGTNMSQGFNNLGTTLNEQYKAMPTMFANALKGSGSTTQSFIPVSSTSTNSQFSSTLPLNKNTLYVSLSIWNQLPYDVKRAIMCARQGINFDGNNLFVVKNYGLNLIIQFVIY